MSEVMLSVRVPEELRRRVRVAVASADSSMEAFVTSALERALTEPGAGSSDGPERSQSREVAGSIPIHAPGSVSDSGGKPMALGAAAGGEERDTPASAATEAASPESPPGCWDHRGNPKAWCQHCQDEAKK